MLEERSKYLVEVFEKHIPKNLKILEIGCGDGRNMRFLNKAGYKKVIGIDKELGSSIEDVEMKPVDVVYTMSTLFLIPPENDWIFEKVAKLAKKFIITIEGETTKGQVYGRDYNNIFSKFGFKQVDYKNNIFNEFGVMRVLKYEKDN